MLNMLPGLRKFSEQVYPDQKPLFDSLANGQHPHTMLITCADSRIDPNLITQTAPGELFVVRNAGNIVPPFGAANGGEQAAIEFGIEGLGVQNIVVCGHSKCGAMAALSQGIDAQALPSTAAWLGHASATKRILADKSCTLNECIEQNVLVQIQNLKTHPAVATGINEGRLKLFAWTYHFEKGYVAVYHNGSQKFVPSPELDETSASDIAEFAL